MSVVFLAGRVCALHGDITRQDVDAIVNAANTTLLGGDGVDGAIHAKGGPEILHACEEIRRTRFPQGLPTGEAVITTAGRLAARHVIHTVGPICRLGQEPNSALLATCYRNSLLVAAENGLRSIAFPAISTGAFGYPREKAASVVSAAVESFLEQESTVAEIRLVFFDTSDLQVFLRYQRFREL